MKFLPVIAFAPLVIAVVVAGTVTNPDRTRPCAVEYSRGVSGGPLHITLGTDGKLYTTESTADRILQFDPNTHRTHVFKVPKGTIPHDIVRGPGRDLWFDGLSGVFGKLDPRTGKVTMYPGISPEAQPHDLVWDDGQLYIAELVAGRLARFDPETGQVVEGAVGLPPNSQIHSLRALPNGDIWASLSNGNALARFDPRKGRFDKIVKMPIRNSGPRDLVYVPSRHAIYFTFFAANKFGRYDLRTGKVTLYRTGVKPVSLATAETPAQVEKLTFINVDASQRNVWASTFGGELVRLDLATGRTQRVHCGITFPAATAGITNDAKGRLWVVEAFPGRLARIEP